MSSKFSVLFVTQSVLACVLAGAGDRAGVPSDPEAVTGGANWFCCEIDCYWDPEETSPCPDLEGCHQVGTSFVCEEHRLDGDRWICSTVGNPGCTGPGQDCDEVDDGDACSYTYYDTFTISNPCLVCDDNDPDACGDYTWCNNG